jgi:hypothetical protein
MIRWGGGVEFHEKIDLDPLLDFFEIFAPARDPNDLLNICGERKRKTKNIALEPKKMSCPAFHKQSPQPWAFHDKKISKKNSLPMLRCLKIFASGFSRKRAQGLKDQGFPPHSRISNR